MGRRTIYISDGDTVSEILECCPQAARVMEKYFGQDFLRRDNPDRVSLGVAATLHREQVHPILVELNRTCL
jgi:hypothetical protein